MTDLDALEARVRWELSFPYWYHYPVDRYFVASLREVLKWVDEIRSRPRDVDKTKS